MSLCALACVGVSVNGGGFVSVTMRVRISSV